MQQILAQAKAKAEARAEALTSEYLRDAARAAVDDSDYDISADRLTDYTVKKMPRKAISMRVEMLRELKDEYNATNAMIHAAVRKLVLQQIVVARCM